MPDATNPSVDVVVPHRCDLGEGPVWDEERQAICWVDILPGHIHEYRPGERVYSRLEIGQMAGAVALREDGHFMAALQHGFAFVDRENGTVVPICDPEEDDDGNRFNDGKCDPAGRFWAGTMALDERAGAGNLYMMDGALNCHLKKTGVSISNGLAWSGDQKKMYYIDSPTHSVTVFDYDPSRGDIGPGKVAFRIPEEEGTPDGMTIDREGMLWIAHWDGWQVARWHPGSGEKLLSIPLPAARITSCTFGGPDYRDLYVTSAATGLTDDELAVQPLAGSLFVVRGLHAQGEPASRFLTETPLRT